MCLLLKEKGKNPIEENFLIRKQTLLQGAESATHLISTEVAVEIRRGFKRKFSSLDKQKDL